MDLVYLLVTIWRKKIPLIIVPLVSVGIAYFLTKDIQKMYYSSSQVATGFTSGEGIQLTESFNWRDADLKFSNLLSTMRSGIMYDLLSYRLLLHDLDSTLSPFRTSTEHGRDPISTEELTNAKMFVAEKLQRLEPLSVGDENFNLINKVLSGFGYRQPWLAESLGIRRVSNTDYVEISCTAKDNYLSAFAVNAYIEEFKRYYAYQKLQSSGESVDFFQELVNQKKAELDQKSLALQNYKEDSNFIATEGQSSSDQLINLDEKITDTRTNIYGLQLKLNYLNEGLTNSSEKASSTNFDNRKVIQLRQKISSVNSRYINSGSRDLVLRDSLVFLRDQLNFELSFIPTNSTGSDKTAVEGLSPAEIKSQIKNTEIELAIENSKLSQLNTQLRNLKGIQFAYASKEAGLSALQTEVDVASQEYIDVVNRYNEVKNKSLASTSALKQVNLAVPSAEPVKSKRLLIIGFSGFLSFSIVLMMIVGLVLLDGSIKTTSRLESLIDLKLIGSLVKVNLKKLEFDSVFTSTKRSKSEEIFIHSLRKIRHVLESSGGQIFLVSSTKRSEGKSFVTFSLSYVLSLVQKRILLIDTNFRNNDLTKHFRQSGKKEKGTNLSKIKNGIELITMESANGFDNLNSIINSTRYKNIFYIGNYEGQNSPDEIIPSEHFTEVLTVLRSKFDYIFLEGPAMNDFADTKELEQYADKIIIVTSADSSIKQLDKESIQYLEGLENKTLGVILNLVDPKNLNL